MPGISELVIILVIGTVTLILPVAALLWFLKNRSSNGNSCHSKETTRLLQEMHQSFARMEAQMDALETKVLEREE